MVPRIAHEMGMRVSFGAWITNEVVENDSANEAELNALIEACHKYPNIDVAIIGNEVLTAMHMPPEKLIGYIRRVRKSIPSHIKVTTAEVLEVLCEHPNIVIECDLLYVHIYPFWKKLTPHESERSLHDGLEHAKGKCKGKQLVIAETGWPSSGVAVGKAVPSLENAAKYWHLFQKWARENHLDYFYFSAFDEAWKTNEPNQVGPHWGLLDAMGEPKFQLHEK